MTLSIFRIILVWIVFAGAIYFAVSSINVPKMRILSQRGVMTEGVILDLYPKKHLSIQYSFTVNGKKIVSIGHSDVGNPAFDDLRIGESLLVYYDPSDPNISVLGNPAAVLRNEVFVSCVAAIMGSTFVVIRLWKKML